MAEGQEWEAALQAAWTQLRSEVADALAELEEGRCVALEFGPELLDGFDDDESGAAPYVQATAYGDGMVRIEAVSNHYLDEQFELDGDGVEVLLDIGWFEPTSSPDDEADEGSSNFWFDVESREADLGAVMLVETMREVYGCLHPTLLATVGVHPHAEQDDEDDDEAEEEEAEAEVADFDDLSLSWASNRLELEASVIETLSALRGEHVVTDVDGDVPIRVGQSMAFVRVLSSRPAVEFFAELVVGLEQADPAALARELNILNRQHSSFTFYAVDSVVMMQQVLIGVPLVPLHVKIALETFCDAIDDIARDLSERVGGRRFFDPRREVTDNDEPVETIDDPAVVALVELLRDGRLPTRSVIELFGASRHRLVEALSGVRSGAVSCESVDEERVLACLRRATRAVTRADAERTRASGQASGGGRLSAVADSG